MRRTGKVNKGMAVGIRARVGCNQHTWKHEGACARVTACMRLARVPGIRPAGVAQPAVGAGAAQTAGLLLPTRMDEEI